MLLILYARIVDNKKKGLVMEGPFYGPECETMAIAHEKCRELVTPSKDHILVKVYDLDEIDYQGARELALTHFKRTFEFMESAQSLCDRPNRKRS